jgi:uncharacterized repeat protein (TIGR01451 family)
MRKDVFRALLSVVVSVIEWRIMTHFFGRKKNEQTGLKQELRSRRSFRPRVRYALVAMLVASVLAAGASANMTSVATTSATNVVRVVQHLTSSKKVSHSTAPAARETPDADQYTAPLTPPTVGNPKILVSIDPPSQSTTQGDSVTFTIDVSNTGNVPLTGVSVGDTNTDTTTSLSSASAAGASSGSCSRSIGKLAKGASHSYTCTKTDAVRSFKSVVKATGTSAAGKHVTSTDSAVVAVKTAPLTPPQVARLSIVKSPKMQKLTTKILIVHTASGATTHTVSFGSAHFTITVTNHGNVKLTGVGVRDALSPACDRTLGSLAPGATHTYHCVSMMVRSTFTNVAVVSGKPPKGASVSATAHAAVIVKTKTTTHSVAPITTG